MGKANHPFDVFKHINMHGGDRSVCWEWNKPVTAKNGRPYFDVDGRKVLAYRHVFEITHGKVIPPGKMLLHQCDNKICCNPFEGHACRIGTHKQNMKEMKERQRHGLPHTAVKAIRRLLDSGEKTHKQISDDFGVSRELITAINNDKVYQHVEDEKESEHGNQGS